jgi:hypothetical protein
MIRILQRRYFDRICNISKREYIAHSLHGANSSGKRTGGDESPFSTFRAIPVCITVS